MKKKIKKSRVLWLYRNWAQRTICLYSEEPVELYKRAGGLENEKIFEFCDSEFRQLFPIGIRRDWQKKVKITIEVIG